MESRAASARRGHCSRPIALAARSAPSHCSSVRCSHSRMTGAAHLTVPFAVRLPMQAQRHALGRPFRCDPRATPMSGLRCPANGEYASRSGPPSDTAKRPVAQDSARTGRSRLRAGWRRSGGGAARSRLRRGRQLRHPVQPNCLATRPRHTAEDSRLSHASAPLLSRR